MSAIAASNPAHPIPAAPGWLAVGSTGPQTTNTVSGARQVGLGKFLTDDTGGRYEAIAAPTRVMTLLPEFGETVAKAHIRQNQQYLVTVERPDGRSGDLGELAIGVTRPGVTGVASLDGRGPVIW